MSIVVFGSINMDLVARTPRLPSPGETLTGHSFATVPGGKGANQAVACARAGARTRMIGRVGDDVFGAALRESLVGYGVDVSGVATEAGSPSGVAPSAWLAAYIASPSFIEACISSLVRAWMASESSPVSAVLSASTAVSIADLSASETLSP